MTRKLLLTVPLLLCFTLILAGCNIFGWASKEDRTSLLDQGHELMREAKYAEAAAKYAEAMENDPEDSDARYYHAKAIVHASGFNALGLATVMSDAESNSGNFPFYDWSNDSLTLLHQTVGTVFEDLKPIMDGKTKGNFDASDVDLDMGIASSIRAITRWKDINGDDIIDEASDFDIDFVESQAGKWTLDSATLLDFLTSNGGKAGQRSDNGDMSASADSIITLDTNLIVSWNNLLDDINELIEYSTNVLISIIEAHVDSSGQYDGNYQLSDIDSLLNEIQHLSRIYKVNDHVLNHPDSPYVDSDGDGRINEELLNASDDDGDGWADEDLWIPFN